MRRKRINEFFYDVNDNEPEIYIAGRVMIDTLEERENALAENIRKVKTAYWMFDHNATAEAEA